MLKSSPACKLLLLTPALFIMLQMALLLHHHKTNSYHDGHDYLNSVSISADKHYSALNYFTEPTYKEIHAELQHTKTTFNLRCSNKTSIFSSPPKSRAPPTAKDA